MKKINLLSRAEMKKVMGGNAPGEGDCVKTCICEDGTTMEAKISGCDKGTCNLEGTGAVCKIDGVTHGQSCATVCGG